MHNAHRGRVAPVVDRRRLLQAGIALGVGLMAPAAPACEFYTTGFTILHPWTRASAEGASTAIVSMKFLDVTQADRLIGVRTMVAEDAELRGPGAGPALDFAIAEGQLSALSEEAVHLRLLGLKLPLLVGREYPMTLVFANVGEVPTKLTVDYARFG